RSEWMRLDGVGNWFRHSLVRLHERLSGFTPFCRRRGKGHGYEQVVFTDRSQLDESFQYNGLIAMGAKSAIPIGTLDVGVNRLVLWRRNTQLFCHPDQLCQRSGPH